MEQPPQLVALGRAVREAREQRGLTQVAMAELCGLQRSYLADIERGRRNVGYLNVLRIANALQLPASDLLKRAERANPEVPSP